MMNETEIWIGLFALSLNCAILLYAVITNRNRIEALETN